MLCRFAKVCMVWTRLDGKDAKISVLPKHSYLAKNPDHKAHSDGPDVTLNRNIMEQIVSEKFVKQKQAHVPEQIRNHPRLAHRAQ